MKRKFKLIEALSSRDAMKIFGIDEIPSKEELKTLYKNLVRKNHPDLGGSTEAMANINSAMDVLSTLSPGVSSRPTSRADMEAFRAKEKERKLKIFEYSVELFDQSFDLDTLVAYVQKFSSEKLEGEVWKNLGKQNSYYFDGSYSPTVNIKTADNKTYFQIMFNIKYVEPAQNGLAGNVEIDPKDILYTISYDTSLYHDSRKHKLSQRTWQWGKKHSVLSSPEELFPPVKLKKIFGGVKKSFKKADFLLGIQRELSVNLDKDIIFIYPLGKDAKFYVSIGRSTFRGYRETTSTAYYNWGNIQYIDPTTQKYKLGGERFSYKETGAMEETPETLNGIVEVCNSLKKYSDKNNLDPFKDGPKLVKYLKDMVELTFPPQKE